MISTAIALIDAVTETIMEDETMLVAKELLQNRNTDSETFAKALYLYSGLIATVAVDRATKILLTETQVKELMATLGEMDTLRDEVLNGK